MSKPIALIIEDRPEICMLWERAILPLGFDVRKALSFTKGLEIMQVIPPPDLVLLDLRLDDSPIPEQTIRRVDELRKFNPKVVVIILSGYLTPELVNEAIERGVQGITAKQDLKAQNDLWKLITQSLQKADALTILEQLNTKIIDNLPTPLLP